MTSTRSKFGEPNRQRSRSRPVTSRPFGSSAVAEPEGTGAEAMESLESNSWGPSHPAEWNGPSSSGVVAVERSIRNPAEAYLHWGVPEAPVTATAGPGVGDRTGPPAVEAAAVPRAQSSLSTVRSAWWHRAVEVAAVGTIMLRHTNIPIRSPRTRPPHPMSPAIPCHIGTRTVRTDEVATAWQAPVVVEEEGAHRMDRGVSAASASCHRVTGPQVASTPTGRCSYRPRPETSRRIRDRIATGTQASLFRSPVGLEQAPCPIWSRATRILESLTRATPASRNCGGCPWARLRDEPGDRVTSTGSDSLRRRDGGAGSPRS